VVVGGNRKATGEGSRSHTKACRPPPLPPPKKSNAKHAPERALHGVQAGVVPRPLLGRGAKGVAAVAAERVPERNAEAQPGLFCLFVLLMGGASCLIVRLGFWQQG
jgi:hypothetical protein